MSAAYERALIGAALLEVDRHNLIDLDPEAFTDRKLAEIWRHIRTMPRVDTVELSSKFGDEFLAALLTETASSVRMADMAAKIREGAHRRNVSASLRKAYEMLNANAPMADVAMFINAQFDAVKPAQEARPIVDLMIDAYRDVEAAKANRSHNFIPTGFRDFDRRYGGLPKDGLVVIAGRPAMGKTAFAAAVARNVASEKPVLVISMEMSGQSLAMRYMASETNVNLQNLMRGDLAQDDWRKLAGSVERLKSARMWINDMANRSVGDICAEARRFHRKHGEAGIVVIDYLTLIDLGKGDTQNERVSQATRALKMLAMEIKCPVVLLSQLSRKPDERANKQPMMSDLRDSGAIEQDADVILFPFREEVYRKTPENEGRAELIVAKYRNGEAGTAIDLAWVSQSAKFADLNTDF